MGPPLSYDQPRISVRIASSASASTVTATEYVELDTFVPKCEALARFLWGRR